MSSVEKELKASSATPEGDGGRQVPVGEQKKESTKKSSPQVSISTLVVMATLLVFGIVGTSRMRRHAVRGTSDIILTPQELSMYTGRRGSPIYISILGSVYDVSSGRKTYGPGGSYDFFAGRDASRAFVTGKFKEDLNDNVRDLNPESMSNLIEWRTFYENHATYTKVGKVVGSFFDIKGHAKPLLAIVEMNASKYVKEQEEKKKNASSEIPCAFKWHKDTGGFVSCEQESTYPRRVMMRQGDGTVKERCLCLPLQTELNATVILYDNCPPESSSCQSSPLKNSSNQSSPPPKKEEEKKTDQDKNRVEL